MGHSLTRNPEGRRGRVALAILGLALLGAGAAAADDPDSQGPLPWRVTGRVGFTVDAATFPDSAGHTLEVYLRVPPATLARLGRNEAGEARVRVTTRVTNRFGGRSQERSQEFAITASDTVPGFGKVVIMRFPTRPGSARLRVKLEDLLTRKRGIGYLGRRVAESAQVEGEFAVPEPQAGRDLSDLEFVWEHAPVDAATAFRRAGSLVIPNPERLYGLLAGELRAQFAARGLPGDVRPWHWHARVLDAGGQVVAEQQRTGEPGRRLAATVTIDVATMPAGGYELEVKAWQEGDGGALLRSARFSIGWRPSTWLVDPSELDDAVHFLLSAEEETRFAAMQVGERERFLDDFWRERDPTPDTAENEARTAFLARIAYANRNFDSRVAGRGMFSDMGRVYIRYGEPDEILRQVIPAGDETLLQAIREIELRETRPTGDVHQKGLGGDTRPYEVWVYDGSTIPAPDVDPALANRLRARRRVVFLFVDEHGYGSYTLRYSTE